MLQANVAYFVAAIPVTVQPIPPTAIHYSPFSLTALSLSAARFSSRISHKPTTRASVRQSVRFSAQIPFLCVLDFIPCWLILPSTSPSPSLVLPSLPFAVGKCNTCRMHTIIISSKYFSIDFSTFFVLFSS